MANKWLRIDPHVHSKGISRCSLVTCEQIIDEKIRLGYDGAILTNHCQQWYYSEDAHSEFMEKIISEYQCGKRYAEKKGFCWYLGIEVSLNKPHYADWLLYGVTEEFLRCSACLYSLSQEELFEYCNKWGVVMIQAHPYRQTPCNPQYMHGVEINCSSGDLDKLGLVEEFAKKHNLLVTCGTDYHFTENAFRGGIYIPEHCKTAADIAKWIRENKRIKVFFGEKDMVYEGELLRNRQLEEKFKD